MRRFIIALLMFCTMPAHAGDFDFGFNWQSNMYSSLVVNLPLTSSVGSSSTFTRSSTQWYLDDSSAYQSVASGVPAFNSKGLWIEPATTNKVTCYNDLTESNGSNITSGALVIGRKYQIVTRTTFDFTTVGAANNNSGTQFILTGACTLGANDVVFEIINAIGTIARVSGGSTTAIRGVTIGGDAAATATITSDTSPLATAGLTSVVSSGRVIKLDASAGSTTATVRFSGSTGNTNPHSAYSYIRTTVGGAGVRLEDSSGGSWTSFTESGPYIKLSAANKTPASTGVQLAARVAALGIAYIILPQMEETVVPSSPVITAGATATRAATVESVPTGGFSSSAAWSMSFEWTPAVTGAFTRYLWGSYTDANNAMQILYDGTTVTFRKRVGGTNHDATKTLSATAGTTYRVSVRVNTDKTTDILIAGVKGTGSADTTPPVIAATMQLGADGNGANQIVGQIRNFKVWRQARPDASL